MWYMYVVMFACRMKYYTAWLLTDTACIASGYAFNGYEKGK